MAQPSTGASPAWQKKRPIVAEKFLRIDARGFHQGQDSSKAASTNRPDTLTHDGCVPSIKKVLRIRGRPYIFLSLDDDLRALEFAAQFGVVAIELLSLSRLCVGLRSTL